MKSWKTTSTGILTILGALVTLWYKRHELAPEIIMGAAMAILTGIGLIAARDNDKSSEAVGASTAMNVPISPASPTPPPPAPARGLLLLGLAVPALLLAGCAFNQQSAVTRGKDGVRTARVTSFTFLSRLSCANAQADAAPHSATVSADAQHLSSP